MLVDLGVLVALGDLVDVNPELTVGSINGVGLGYGVNVGGRWKVAVGSIVGEGVHVAGNDLGAMVGVSVSNGLIGVGGCKGFNDVHGLIRMVRK